MRYTTGKKSNILIIHDRFMFRGGAERLVLDLAKGLKADIMTAMWNEQESFSREDVPFGLHVLGFDPGRAVFRYLYFQYLFLAKSKIAREYDVVIFSGNNCLSAYLNIKRGVKKIFYCHTPVRHAYDLREFYLQNMPWLKRQIFRFLIFGSRLVYWWGFRKMDIVIANSQNVAERIRKYLRREPDYIVYPPIDIDKFKYIDTEDYYLSFARVDRLKRVTDVVKAFQRMPDKNLIVASGGDELETVKKLSENYSNIQILGWVDDSTLADLVGRCIATIYIPINEDFGMTPLESMAAGKPCIGVAEGGLKETIIHNQTGYLISPDYTLDDIVKAVHFIDKDKSLAMKDTCIAHARKFSSDNFIQKMKEIVEKTKEK